MIVNNSSNHAAVVGYFKVSKMVRLTNKGVYKMV